MSTSSFIRPSHWFRRWWPLLALGLAVLVVMSFLALGLWIQIVARDAGTVATKEFPGDRVEALVRLVESERRPLSERNRAVWALGQLRDPRALPVLRKYYTGRPCDHARYLCQSELRKAILLCEGKTFDPVKWLTPEALRQ